MMADIGGGPPERPGGKKGLHERDFRPDFTEDEEDDDDGQPTPTCTINMRLHVHFSF